MKIVKPHTSQTNARKWRSLYECRCGKQFEAVDAGVRAGHTTSCGCVGRSRGAENGRKSAKHNAVGTITYKSWANMHARCSTPSNGGFKRYGACGIKVCARWRDFRNFLADMGERPGPEYTLGRIDHDKDYKPGNVRWQTRSENTRDANYRRYA